MTVFGTMRARIAVFAVVVALAVAVAGAAFARAIHEDRRKDVPTAATARDRALDLGSVLDSPHVVFRSTAPGPTYGMLAAVPLANPGGDRSVSDLECDRVYATATAGICLSADRGMVTTYRGILLDDRMQPTGATVPVNGAPSRARLSPDGSLAATTVFLAGHGYGTIGFSTETVISGVGPVATGYGNLEKSFRTVIDGKRSTAADLNVWGVTFVPGSPDAFYATLATGGRTWLARGSLRARTLTSLRTDAECPSISPDGRHLLYKKRAGSPIRWRYHVLDLQTGVEQPLGEARSIDDQAEWLDDGNVLYGLARAGSGETDVWAVGIAPGSKPGVLIEHAWSPGVVRAAAAPAPEGTETPSPSVTSPAPSITQRGDL